MNGYLHCFISSLRLLLRISNRLEAAIEKIQKITKDHSMLSPKLTLENVDPGFGTQSKAKCSARKNTSS